MSGEESEWKKGGWTVKTKVHRRQRKKGREDRRGKGGDERERKREREGSVEGRG